jgi:hypothetical protein
LKFTPNWLPEKLFDVPAVTVDVWVFAWPIDEDAVALVDGGFAGDGDTTELVVAGSFPDDADATETELPVLKFTLNWLHEGYWMYQLYELLFDYYPGVLTISR